MAVIHFENKEISAKIVYYGPGLCGKTTSLQTIHEALPAQGRAELMSIATKIDRTIFFDFLPVVAFRVRDFRVRLQLYTVPGQVFYNDTRKLVLSGVDGLVCVLDSQVAMRDSNLESMQNLADNLASLGLDQAQIPMVFQFNKRDLPKTMTLSDMDKLFNPQKLPVFATVAQTGEGVFDVLRAISQSVVNSLLQRGLVQELKTTKDMPPTTVHMGVEAQANAENSPSNHALAATEFEPTSLWPASWAQTLTMPIDTALQRGQHADTVLAVQSLLQHVAKDALGQISQPNLEALLFARDVSVGRYRAYKETLRDVESGKAIRRAQAMNAVVLALAVAWW